jgi:UDP-N-acetylglucosamine 2-epimerase (non-hydrolysing)
MLKILSIIGTRPEAIKMAPVIEELNRHEDQVQSVFCSAGQHREMLNQVLQVLKIKPDFELGLMKPSQSLSGLTAALLTELSVVIEKVKPDWILAQGDTTTTMVAGLVAFYHGIRFGHVEAGLRTGDRQSPFPEEINRRIADLVADLYFAPTERARRTLLDEGVPEDRVRVTGNTVIDALLTVAGREYHWNEGPLGCLPSQGRLVLITAHRRESFGKPFRELCHAIRGLATEFAHDGVHFVYPVHLNPNVRRPVQEILSGLDNLSLIEPLDYVDLVQLMRRSTLILTDSGGIQEEAPTFGVPVLVMRDTTERPEGIEAGVARLVGTQHQRIVQEATRLLRDQAAHAAMATRHNPYGDGKAAGRIVSALLEQSRNP